MANTLNIYYQNCRGIRGKLQTLYINIISDTYDVLVLTETWLFPDIVNDEFIDQRYNIFRCDRDRHATGKQDGGGVLIAILRTLHPTYFDNMTQISWSLHAHMEYLLVQIPSRDRGRRHIFSAVYIPPRTPDDVYVSYLDMLSTILNNSSTHCFYIIGDFNLPNINWSLHNAHVTDQTGVNGYLLNFISEVNAIQYHNLPNINNRTLDLLISNENCDILQPLNYLVPADPHHPPFSALSSPYIVYSPMKRCPIIKYNYYRGNYDLVKGDLIKINWSNIFENSTSQEAINIFYEKIFGIIRKHIPQKPVPRNNNDFPIWFSKPLIYLFKNKNKAWIKWKIYKNISDYEQFTLYRRRFNRECIQSYRNYIKTAEQNIRKNPKFFWKYVAGKRGNSGIPSSVYYKNVSTSDPLEICKLFSHFFQSVYEPSTFDINKWVQPESYNNSSEIINDIHISSSKILNALKSLDISKGPGPDGIPPLFFKKVAAEICIPVSSLS